MNSLVYIENLLRNNIFKLKGVLLRIYLLAHGCGVGKGLRCHTFPRFRISPCKNIIIGKNTTIGYDITCEILPGGKLVIGDYVKLTQNILISSGSEISIGDFTLVGENVSIRDGDHGYSIGKPITLQSCTYQPVNIGNDVWIGAGCFILKGSAIPDGVIIGANSIVLIDTQFEKNCIYAGSPVKKIGNRP